MSETTRVVRVSVESAGKIIAELTKQGLAFTAEEFRYNSGEGDGWIKIIIHGY